MSVKDPFEILADEITLIRRQIDQLQRTSLDRKEAEKLNAVVAQGLDRMAKVGPAVQNRIEQSLATACPPSTRPPKAPRMPSARHSSKASRQQETSARPPEKPAERPGGGLAGSGCG